MMISKSKAGVVQRKGKSKRWRAQMRERFYPGEFFTIGPHRFEIDAKAELPLPAPNALPADPAGDPDISLAAEYERIVPSWRSQLEGKEAQVATQLPAIPAVPAWRRLLLPAAAFVVLGGAAYSWLVPRGGEDARSERPNLPVQARLAAAGAPGHVGLLALVPRLERRIGLFDTGAMPWLVQAGRRAAEAALPDILALLARSSERSGASGRATVVGARVDISGERRAAI